MRGRILLAAGAAVVAVLVAASPPSDSTVTRGVGPSLQSIGTLAFGPNGVLYAADPEAATIYALEMGEPATGVPAGTKAIPELDKKIAALLGTDAAQLTISDLIVDSRTRNSYISVMRGQGNGAQPALLRVDGNGRIDVVSLENVRFSSVTLPNPPAASPNGRSNRSQSVMDMAFVDGRLFVAGLSNEEFASKLWAIPYPFAAANNGTSLEIFHGNHGRLETRSPVYSFIPFKIGDETNLIAGYLCTPLVKFAASSLAPGSKVLGTTIAELGNRNRPIDMILYDKEGQNYLLMSNTDRGVMKIPTARFGTATPITEPVPEGTAGIGYETIASLTGVQQMDKLDATHSVIIARNAAGALNLDAVILP